MKNATALKKPFREGGECHSTYFKVDKKGYRLRPKLPKSLENYYPKINKPEKNEAQISEIEGPGENTAFSQFSQNNRSVRRPTRRQYIPRQISLQQVAAKSNFRSKSGFTREVKQPTSRSQVELQQPTRQQQQPTSHTRNHQVPTTTTSTTAKPNYPKLCFNLVELGNRPSSTIERRTSKKLIYTRRHMQG